jgi:hypothetical protein
VCSSRGNDYDIDLGLNSLGKNMVGGAMALPGESGVAQPSRINFTEDEFYSLFLCYICNGEFGSMATFDAHMETKHPLRYNCRFCQMGFGNNTLLTDHINANHVTWSTSTYEDVDDELKGNEELSDGEIFDGKLSEGEINDLLGDSGDSNETSPSGDSAETGPSDDSNGDPPRDRADDHDSTTHACQQCQTTEHFSVRCRECRHYRQRDCPDGPVIKKSSKQLAERLEYTRSIPLIDLEGMTTPPTSSISGVEPIRRTTTTPSLKWAQRPVVEPIPTTMVLPVTKGSPVKKRGGSTSRKKTPKGVTSPDKQPPPRPQQRPDESLRDGPTDGGEIAKSCGRSGTRRRSTPRKATPSTSPREDSRDDLRKLLRTLRANKSRGRSKRKCMHCGTTEPHGFGACPAINE